MIPAIYDFLLGIYLKICIIVKDSMDKKFNCYFHYLHYFQLLVAELFCRLSRGAKTFVLFNT